MGALLTFVIPVRHPYNARNLPQSRAYLEQTIKSISAQTSSNWQCIIVANEKADLPPLSEKFQACFVDFPPNDLHEQGDAERDVFYEAIRLDKGRRLLAGMLKTLDTQYFMVVDDDDFIHRDLVSFVSQNKGGNGWFFQTGYVWTDGGNVVYKHPEFYKFCGTSHIIRADLLNLPDRFEYASDDYIRQVLGTHLFIDKNMEGKGTPLSPLPFPGAIYRIGHDSAHSKSLGLFKTFIFRKKCIRQPHLILQRLGKMRTLSANIRQKFFG